eukprot:TRINITY_DN8368_c0_g1_i3.p1 TRINITY_DN8368_c0_g1~~TRINITY_DN8368_c0_g1_i3.p1  ORF type:complete len:858 (+),score=172.32 TRINITY_DN8368_c0_g1_i3:387-2960(+)
MSMIASEARSEQSTARAQLAPLEPPVEFPFPFAPYQIQRDFMKKLYTSIEAGGLAIFESPTGTGKSLSLLCGAMAWLRDNEAREDAYLDSQLTMSPTADRDATAASDTPEWATSQAKAIQQREAVKEEMARRDVLRRKKERVNRMRMAGIQQAIKKRGFKSSQPASDPLDGLSFPTPETARPEDPYDEFWLGDYASDDDMSQEMNDDSDDKDEEEQAHATKIIFCSRTHTQLSQFVGEIQSSPYGDTARVVALASRGNLCTYPDVNKLTSLTSINEACMDLQKAKREQQDDDEDAYMSGKSKRSKASAGCPMLESPVMKSIPDRILAQPRDIEELATLGKKTGTCPYYAARKAVPAAEVVVAPYNLLLHKSTRETTGLVLKDNVVVIDEAHNLMDTIASIHSVSLQAHTLMGAHRDLLTYCQKYKKRLKAKNLMYIKQLLSTFKRWMQCLADVDKAERKSETLQPVNEFLFTTETAHVNFFKLLRYCDRSQLARKLLGFMEKRHREEGSVNSGSRHVSPLRQVEAFLQALTNASGDGRVVVAPSTATSKAQLKFVLLNPAVYFEDILREARCVVVAGGTMSPVDDFVQQLTTDKTASVPVHFFSCDHIVGGDKLLPIALTHGPSQRPLKLAYKEQKDPAVIAELGQLLLTVCHATPDGVVVFVPSYDAEERLYQTWKQQGCLAKLMAVKDVYREPRTASDTDSVLAQYASSIDKGKGALILCVVGGKLSEGINFKDRLGRCVVMFGLPFPNLHSPELKEKMAYLKQNQQEGKKGQPDKGQEYYYNLCMKAVNQSIGRAIRHQHDYAAILLVDVRYSEARIHKRLPTWISKHMRTSHQVEDVKRSLLQFFARQAPSGP